LRHCPVCLLGARQRIVHCTRARPEAVVKARVEIPGPRKPEKCIQTVSCTLGLSLGLERIVVGSADVSKIRDSSELRIWLTLKPAAKAVPGHHSAGGG
jgi:hypothetical protein